jgi:8-amino-7-oxononanoate synthase
MKVKMSTSWIDEFPARIAELDRAHLRRKRRGVVPEGGARMPAGHLTVAERP